MNTERPKTVKSFSDSPLLYKSKKLYFGEHDVAELAKKYGTPLYLYDLTHIRRQIRKLKREFKKSPDIHYALKANSNEHVLRVMQKEGVGLDVVSGGEILWGLKQGFKGSDMIFSGVGKTVDEIELAIKENLKLLIAESPQEVERIAKIAKLKKRVVTLGLRFNPDVSAETHPFITTGFRENKFGMERDLLDQALGTITKNKKYLKLESLSLHIGSQLKSYDALEEAIERSLPIFDWLRSKEHSLMYFDVGGGIAINYFDGEKYPTLRKYVQVIERATKRLEAKLILEPGRFLVGAAGSLITEVQYVKSTRHKNFVIVDTGMHHLIRPTLYRAYHRILPVQEGAEALVADVVGPICESSDFLGRSVKLPKLNPEDLLAIGETGAYGFTMASIYNLKRLPQEVAVAGRKIFSKKTRGQDQLFPHLD